MNMQFRQLYALKLMSKEEFDEKYGRDDELFDNIQHALSGHIKVTKVSDNYGYLSPGEWREGKTPLFGEGIALWICGTEDDFYHTSTIQSIDWENNTFKTLNSTYKFEFNESKN